jgi:hypothetical protein
MRRVLLIMPLLVALVACGGSATLTTEEITKKMTAKGLCLDQPDVVDSYFPSQGYLAWDCKSKNGQRIGISVYESKESFRYYLKEIICQRPASFGTGGAAWGANWITSEVASDGADSYAIAKVLGGDADNYDETVACNLIR